MIKQEILKPGEKIASERDISDYQNISRMTVHKAIDELVQENYLYREHGKGTFVSEKIIPSAISPLASFSSEMKKKGIQTSSKILSWQTIKPSPFIAGKLQTKINQDILKFTRLRFIKKKPFLLEKVHLSSKHCPDLTKKEIEKNSLYQLLKEKYYLILSQAEATVEPVLLNNEISRILKTDEDTIGLLFNQTTYLENNEPIEYTVAYYQNDQYKFKFKFDEKLKS